MATPEPTWRDVIRAMRAAIFHLKVVERDGTYRKWEVNDETGGIIAEIHREHLGGRFTWDMDIYGYRMYRAHLENPPPADVFAAARLVKILDTPEELLQAKAEFLERLERQ
jgi:hypothetical protein